MSDAKKPAPRSLLLLVLLSGASGLIFEVVWIRALGLHFGTTAPAVSTVLAAFMGGMTLGNLLFGRIADRSKEPLALYQYVELGIGVFGLLVSLFVLHGDAAMTAAARLTARAGSGTFAVRFAILALVLLIPTTLMGGTLPILARALVRAGTSGQVVGRLYAVNTAGAVLGALAPDLALIPFLGVTASTGVAALLNLAVVGGILRIRWRLGAQSPRSSLSPLPSRGPSSPLCHRAIALFTVSGFAALGIEVLWSRVLSHWTSSRITTFSVLLAVYLVFLALGSSCTRRVADRVRHPLAWAAMLLAASAPAVLLPLFYAGLWRPWQGAFHAPPAATQPSLLWTVCDALQHAVYLEAMACWLWGAAFPFLAAAAVRDHGAGRDTGSLYAFNTAAGVAGSLIAGFALLPAVGQQLGFFILCALCVVVAGAIGLGELRRARPQAMGALAAAVAVAGLIAIQPRNALLETHFSSARGEIRSLHEGATTTAAVVSRDYYGEPAYMELLTPGVSMSDTRLASRRYMGLMGHLGMFLAESKQRALLICYGVGNTARSLLSHPDLSRLDVVDIAPEVIEASPGFAAVHGFDPIAEPRTVATVDDGRSFLVTSEELYDVITSEPPPPNNAGVVNLYSREYYRLARARLSPGGVLTQWLPVHQFAPEATAAMIAAFVAELPNAALFCGYGYQWILVGSNQPLQIDYPGWEKRAALPSVAADLEMIGVEGAPELVASFLQDDRGLRRATQGSLPVTDDHPSIQYPWRSVSEPGVPGGVLGEPTRVLALFRTPPDPAVLGQIRSAIIAHRRALRAIPLSRIALAEERELVFGAAMSQVFAEYAPTDALLAMLKLGHDRVGAARRAIARDPRRADARFELARHAFYTERYAAALEELERISPESVGAAHYWLLVGGAERALGNAERAAAAFLESGAAGSSPLFRTQTAALAAHAAEPVATHLGPLTLTPHAPTPGARLLAMDCDPSERCGPSALSK